TTESGIEYVGGLGATSATQIGTANTDGTSLAIAGGQLYAASTNRVAGAAAGVWQVGNGLPTMPTTLATLPGLSEAYQAAFPNAQTPKQLLFFNHNDGSSNNPDTLFIADQTNGLLKFWSDGTGWHFGNAMGTFGQKLVFGGGATGVAGTVVNPGPDAQFQLYVTGSNVQGQNPNQIAAFFDTSAYNNGFAPGNFSTLAFVGAMNGSPNGNENFAGLAFVPGSHTTPVPPTHSRAGGHTLAGAIDFTLVAAVNHTAVLPGTNQAVPPAPVGAQAPTVATIANGPNSWAVGHTVSSAVPTASGAQVDTFWRLLGARGRRAGSLWSFDSD